jgi:hypothetical protein
MSGWGGMVEEEWFGGMVGVENAGRNEWGDGWGNGCGGIVVTVGEECLDRNG